MHPSPPSRRKTKLYATNATKFADYLDLNMLHAVKTCVKKTVSKNFETRSVLFLNINKLLKNLHSLSSYTTWMLD